MERFELPTFGFGDQRYHQLSYTRFFKNNFAPTAGIEPTTSSLLVKCSSQLSYNGI